MGGLRDLPPYRLPPTAYRHDDRMPAEERGRRAERRAYAGEVLFMLITLVGAVESVRGCFGLVFLDIPGQGGDDCVRPRGCEYEHLFVASSPPRVDAKRDRMPLAHVGAVLILESSSVSTLSLQQ